MACYPVRTKVFHKPLSIIENGRITAKIYRENSKKKKKEKIIGKEKIYMLPKMEKKIHNQ